MIYHVYSRLEACYYYYCCCSYIVYSTFFNQ